MPYFFGYKTNDFSQKSTAYLPYFFSYKTEFFLSNNLKIRDGSRSLGLLKKGKIRIIQNFVGLMKLFVVILERGIPVL